MTKLGKSLSIALVIACNLFVLYLVIQVLDQPVVQISNSTEKCVQIKYK